MYSFDHFEIFIDIGPNYLNEVFQRAAEGNRTLRNDYLKAPISQNNCWSKLSFLGLSKWNKFPLSLQKSVIALILSNIILKNFFWHNLQIK